MPVTITHDLDLPSITKHSAGIKWLRTLVCIRTTGRFALLQVCSKCTPGTLELYYELLTAFTSRGVHYGNGVVFKPLGVYCFLDLFGARRTNTPV